MPRSLRVLYVAPNVPSRVRVRPFNLIRELAARHYVSVLCLVPSADEERDVTELSRQLDVEAVRHSRGEALLRCAQTVVSPTPLWVSYFTSATMRLRLQARLAAGNIDIVHLEHIKTAPWIAGIARHGIPVVYDAVDCATLYLMRRYRSLSVVRPHHKALWGSELLKMQRYEGQAVRRADVTLANSPIDCDWLARLAGPSADVRVLLNGTDLTYFQPWSQPRAGSRLVFCAKLDYFPNAQAAQFLVNKVMPRVWAMQPDAQLTIVGRNPGPEVRRLADAPRVVVTGYVEDVRPYVGGAQVALCPLLVKAGIQNKILEAMALGTPVVATPLGAEGLDVRPHKHLLMATGPDDLAAAILQLLHCPELCDTLAREGRSFVERYHNWSTTAHTLEAIYTECATEKRGSASIRPSKNPFG